MEKGYEMCAILDDETSWRSHIPANLVAAVDIIGHDDIDFERFIELATSDVTGGWEGGREKDSLRLTVESRKELANKLRQLSPLFYNHFLACVRYADAVVGRDNWCIRAAYATDESELQFVIAYRATCVRMADMRITFDQRGTALSASHAFFVPRFKQEIHDAQYYEHFVERGIYAANWTTTSDDLNDTKRKAYWNAFIKWEAHAKKMWPTFYNESQKLYQKYIAAKEANNSFMALHHKKMKKYAEVCAAYV